MCNNPYRRSARIHLSAMIPIIEGIKIEDNAKVEKIAPNCPKVHPLPTVQ